MADDNVRVAVRVRPITQKEVHEGGRQCTHFPGSGQIVLGRDRTFTFDHVFDTRTQQEDVYNTCVSNMVESFFAGYNTTIFAYGQTGTGKTYTMGTGHDDELQQSPGITRRVVMDIFAGIQENMNQASKVTVKVSFLEIYNENVRDLLHPATASKSIAVRDDGEGTIIVIGVKEELVCTAEEVYELLESGCIQRSTAATLMNDTSSRSHSIFTIILEQKWTQADGSSAPENFVISKFHLVDLAGSERAKKTGATGARLKESVTINGGLLALGNVISALGDTQRKIPVSHVPYRDSKLTRLLQDSLGGNSKTLMIACISPADCSLEESMNTLRYANRARNIRNKPVVNRDPHAALIAQLQGELQACKLLLMSHGISLDEVAGVTPLDPSIVPPLGQEAGPRGPTQKELELEEALQSVARELEATKKEMEAARRESTAMRKDRDGMRKDYNRLKDELFNTEWQTVQLNMALEQERKEKATLKSDLFESKRDFKKVASKLSPNRAPKSPGLQERIQDLQDQIPGPRRRATSASSSRRGHGSASETNSMANGGPRTGGWCPPNDQTPNGYSPSTRSGPVSPPGPASQASPARREEAQLEAELRRLAEEKCKLEKNVHDIEQEKNSAEERARQIESLYQRDHEQMAHNLQILNKNIQEREQMIDSLVKDKAKIEEQLNRKTNQIRGMEEQKFKKLHEGELMIKNLQHEVITLREQKESLSAKVRAQQMDAEKLRQNSEKRVQSMKKQIGELQTQNSRTSDETKRKEQELWQMRTKLKLANEQAKQKEGEYQGKLEQERGRADLLDQRSRALDQQMADCQRYSILQSKMEDDLKGIDQLKNDIKKARARREQKLEYMANQEKILNDSRNGLLKRCTLRETECNRAKLRMEKAMAAGNMEKAQYHTQQHDDLEAELGGYREKLHQIEEEIRTSTEEFKLDMQSLDDEIDDKTENLAYADQKLQEIKKEFHELGPSADIQVTPPRASPNKPDLAQPTDPSDGMDLNTMIHKYHNMILDLKGENTRAEHEIKSLAFQKEEDATRLRKQEQTIKLMEMNHRRQLEKLKLDYEKQIQQIARRSGWGQ